jgi:5-carboxymethyl-2-hydroxymuconate isomerase
VNDEITPESLLARYSKDDLYQLAKDHTVPGRSSMTKEELAEKLAEILPHVTAEVDEEELLASVDPRAEES